MRRTFTKAPSRRGGRGLLGSICLSQRESHPSPVLAFDSIGHGKDSVVVLIHGWPLNRSIWSGVAARIAAAGARGVAPGLPGFGGRPLNEIAPAAAEGDPDQGERVDRPVPGAAGGGAGPRVYGARAPAAHSQ